MKDRHLELYALRWLRFEKGCPVALFERTPRYGHGQPDVLGITKAGYLLEIEIKRTMSDFMANGKKRHIQIRGCSGDEVLKRYPKQFWFLVPPELAGKVKDLVPEWAGLLRGPGRNEIQQISSVKPAPSNTYSTKLTTHEKVRLAHCMANQILSFAETIGNLRGYGTVWWEDQIPEALI